MADRKNKRNLQGLLNYALKYTNCKDAPDVSCEPMDPERKQFIENVFKSMFSETNELNNALSVIGSSSSSDEDIISSLDVIRDNIDSIDSSNNFIKIGGASVILKILNRNNIEINARTFHAIAEISQNNPFGQKHFLDCGVLSILINSLPNEKLINSALHAISALTRNFEPGCSEFLRLKGIQHVIACLNTRNSKALLKACFLIRGLSSEYSTIRDSFVEQSTIERLTSCMHLQSVSGLNFLIENILLALCVLSETDEGLTKLANSNFGKEIEYFIKINKANPECEDTLEYANDLLNRLKKKRCA